MNINWFTVIAQVINFVILVWLLKRFLYKPVLKAIDDREQKIASQIKDANDKKAVAEKEAQDFKIKNQDFDQQKKSLMDKAAADADAEKKKLLDEAKAEAATLRTNLEKAAKQKHDNDDKDIAEKSRKHVFAITRKALADIASTNLEKQSINAFIKNLKELKGEELTQFTNAFKSTADAIMIKSAFELSAEEQGEIHDAVNILLSADTKMQFEILPEIIAGIELSTDSYKLSWSFAEYLNSLENHIAETEKERVAATDKQQYYASN